MKTTVNTYQLTAGNVNSHLVGDLARKGVVSIKLAAIIANPTEWRNVFDRKTFLAITTWDNLNLDDTIVHLYTGDTYTPREIFEAVKTEGDTTEIGGFSKIRLIMGNEATLALVSQEIKNTKILDVLTTVTPDIGETVNYDVAPNREWRPQLTVNGRNVGSFNFPTKDVDARRLTIDRTFGYMVFRSSGGYYLGIIGRTGVTWGDPNSELTEEMIQSAADSFTTTPTTTTPTTKPTPRN